MAIIVLGLQQRAIPLGKRFHAVYLIKKKKNESVLVQMGLLLSTIFCCRCRDKAAKVGEPKPNVFDKMNKNVTSIMFSYLDGKDVARLSQTNKRINNLTNNWVVWKNILEEQYLPR